MFLSKHTRGKRKRGVVATCNLSHVFFFGNQRKWILDLIIGGMDPAGAMAGAKSMVLNASQQGLKGILKSSSI
jgi:hypothetical protein